LIGDFHGICKKWRDRWPTIYESFSSDSKLILLFLRWLLDKEGVIIHEGKMADATIVETVILIRWSQRVQAKVTKYIACFLSSFLLTHIF